MVGDLAFKLPRPAARDRGTAGGATALWSEAVIFNEIAVALDQQFAAVVTASIFQIANHSGQISRIDIFQAGLRSDFGGTQQIFGSGVVGIVHLVVLVKCSHVPWNEWRDAGEKLSQATQFVLGIVKARNQQSDDL